tara:strand:- start:143 stop:595 length:453 start_codon:yes stop_codon:yes gene_type:complete
MFYSDLSNYDYFFSDNSGKFKNVSWLEKNKAFTKGNVSFEFTEKLKGLFFETNSYLTEANLMRGPSHCCNLCGKNEIALSLNGETKTLGLCEIWTPSEDGELIMISPSMIIHYIEAHDYLPPEVFIDAVMDIDLTSSFNESDLNLEILLK